ncbi:MAG: hypothetical protein Q8R02_00125 [Hyphomonadaceae bacterium]|nr:hypothetical protein [Hyphomonadaceae bacterium]
MSYDLLMIPAQFDAAAIRDWLGYRPHVDLRETEDSDGVTTTQAVYSNEDTGVYFAFSISERGIPEDGIESTPAVVFNLNYVRPHIFALEAEPEVAAFLQAFGCRIDDPQIDGMGEGAYSREGFLRGWTKGNHIGFQSIGEDTRPPPPWSADPALIEAVWKWNYGRAVLNKERGADIFVPRISWFMPEGAAMPIPAASWTERVLTMLPAGIISHVALVRRPRKSLKGFFGLDSEQPKFELRIVDLQQVANLPGIRRAEVDGVAVLVTPPAGPLETQKIFQGDWPKGGGQILAADQVCGADLVALMKKA